MDTELRKNIRKRWILSLFEFAHIEFQKRLWILADYPKHVGDCTEAICQYFNDLSLEEGYDDFINEQIISQQEFDIIIDFHLILDEYIKRPEKNNLSDAKILKDQEWLNICEMAYSNWKKLKPLIEDIDEIQYIQSLESEFLNI